jgi:beta-phosphoglucomutase-like phosphatase (HAD superfamily)
VLGIPDNSRGCLFDLDGVLTQTARARPAVVVRELAELLDER